MSETDTSYDPTKYVRRQFSRIEHVIFRLYNCNSTIEPHNSYKEVVGSKLDEGGHSIDLFPNDQTYARRKDEAGPESLKSLESEGEDVAGYIQILVWGPPHKSSFMTILDTLFLILFL